MLQMLLVIQHLASNDSVRAVVGGHSTLGREKIQLINCQLTCLVKHFLRPGLERYAMEGHTNTFLCSPDIAFTHIGMFACRGVVGLHIHLIRDLVHHVLEFLITVNLLDGVARFVVGSDRNIQSPKQLRVLPVLQWDTEPMPNGSINPNQIRLPTDICNINT